MKMMKEILTSSFFEALQAAFEARYTESEPVCVFLDYFKDDLYLLVELDYPDLPCMEFVDGMTSLVLAQVAFMKMGDAFRRIFDALTTDYDPLENFFTSGTFTHGKKEELTMEGKEITEPSGKVKVTQKGQSSTSNEGSYSVGQGTTYDNASTDHTSTTDFRNISKNVQEQKTTQRLGDSSGNNLPTTTTEYEDYKSEKSFEDRANTIEFSGTDSENKRGSSGIFSKQDLTQREIRLRLRNRILPIYVRMVVDVFASGVWQSDSTVF